jgi:hypothetical protein
MPNGSEGPVAKLATIAKGKTRFIEQLVMTHAVEVDAAPDFLHLQKIKCHLLPPAIFNPLTCK